MDAVVTTLISEALAVVRSNGKKLPDGWAVGKSGASKKTDVFTRTARSGRTFVSARAGFVARDGPVPSPHVLVRRKLDDEDEIDFVWFELGDDGRVAKWDEASSPKMLELAKYALSL